jgi:hypothetical protein
MLGLRSAKRADYRSCVALGGRREWKPMSSCLDWNAVADLDEFRVRIRYAEYADNKRLPGSREFGRTVCRVLHGCGDHIVRVKYPDGAVSERVVPESAVILTVRLFLGAQCARHGLDMLVEEYEQLGANVTKDAVRMVIRPA